MEDLLKLNEVASAIETEIILPQLNKAIKACAPLVLMVTSMNVMTEPLHQTNKALPQGLYVCPSYGTYNCGSWRMTVQLFNTKDHTIIIKKGTAVARMVAANEIPEMVVAYGLLEEVKDHLDHMLDVGVIKPSKLAWNNAVVLVQKKDRGLRFCINF